MGIKLIWDNDEKTILRRVLLGRWTAEEYLNSVNRAYKLLNGLDHTVHLIIDGTQENRTPTNILSIIRNIDDKIAPNQGMVVLVGVDDTYKSIAKAARKLAPRAMQNRHYANTLDDARRLIADGVLSDPASS
jgi:hypothetical protein